MSETILYFFAGVGAICFLAMIFVTSRLLKKEKSLAQTELSIKNLRRECQLLEQMCNANKVASNKQMDAITDIAEVQAIMKDQHRRLYLQVNELLRKELKELNKQQTNMWHRIQELSFNKKSGPE